MSMASSIRSAAVLGAGTMGAQIAAHFANAGVPVLLLDLTDAVAREGLTRARRLKPDPFFTAGAVELIETGGFDRISRVWPTSIGLSRRWSSRWTSSSR